MAFSEVEKFLDTPVKRYSSGMYVRLAFAVAAHLEPEILIVDEVLAVGDAEFQKKCLGKMGEVARAGRTVILVSHNMPTVQILADKCLLLAGGKVSAFGKTEEVISHYLLSVDSETDCDFSELKRANADYGENVRICAIRPLRSGKLGFRAGEDLSFEVELTVEVPVGGIRFGYSILEVTSAPVMSGFTPPEIQLRGRGRHAFTMTITDPRLAPGNYLFALSVGTGDTRGARHELDVVSPGPGFVVSAISVSGEPVVGWRPEYGRVFHKNCLVHAQTNTQK